MTESTDPILSPTFLFRFEHGCLRCDKSWTGKGIQLDERFKIASFGELEGRPLLADFRCGWNEAGLALNVTVLGKKQAPWCRASRIEDSDGLRVWIDTRDTHTIHRAGRFCHQFVFLPQGSGPANQEPTARMVPIHRAKENPKPAPAHALKVRSEQRIDGYVLEAFIDRAAMTGFDPAEHSRLGFGYAIVDRELGWQTFTIGNDFPIQEDPSLWGTLTLR